MPTGPRGPYSASSVRPATIVGSANGRSISELTMLLPRKSSRTSTQAISVPMTALIAATMNEAISVSFSAATACSLVTAVQNVIEPVLERLGHHRRERDQHDQAQIEPSTIPPASAAPGWARHSRSALRPGPALLWRYFSVGNPWSLLMEAITLFSGSKNSLFTAGQPPRSSIVNRFCGVGYLDLSTRSVLTER